MIYLKANFVDKKENVQTMQKIEMGYDIYLTFFAIIPSGFNKKKFKTIPEYSVNSDFVSKYPRPQRRKQKLPQ